MYNNIFKSNISKKLENKFFLNRKFLKSYNKLLTTIIGLSAFLLSTVLADQTSYLKTSSEISEFRKLNGYAPTVDDYFNWLLNKDSTFTNSETAKLWFDLVKQQKPIIHTKDILSLSKAKRDSIQDFQCKIKVIYDDDDKEGNMNRVFGIIVML
jgi:hypothetical protein